jgi:hypothetical protein
MWPWNKERLRPKSREEDLRRGLALSSAEAERLIRKKLR